MNQMLLNAVHSIQIGVDDFHSSDPRRMLSAVRNVTAGILLLFKEKLRQLSPKGSDDALMKQRILPGYDANDELCLKGFGNKTVDVSQIRERFDALKISVAWKQFQRLVEIRNNIEHYYESEPDEQVREALSDGLIVMKGFIFSELGYEPAALLGTETWNGLLEISAVYQRELEDCHQSVSALDWSDGGVKFIANSLCCPSCDSSLVKTTSVRGTNARVATFLCSGCGKNPEMDDLIEVSLSAAYFADQYLAMTKGGEPALLDCHECGRGTFILSENICAICSAEMKYHECLICSQPLGTDDQDFNGFCGYHYGKVIRDD